MRSNDHWVTSCGGRTFGVDISETPSLLANGSPVFDLVLVVSGIDNVRTSVQIVSGIQIPIKDCPIKHSWT